MYSPEMACILVLSYPRAVASEKIDDFAPNVIKKSSKNGPVTTGWKVSAPPHFRAKWCPRNLLWERAINGGTIIHCNMSRVGERTRNALQKNWGFRLRKLCKLVSYSLLYCKGVSMFLWKPLVIAWYPVDRKLNFCLDLYRPNFRYCGLKELWIISWHT